MPDPDLDLVPTEDLMQALCLRFDAAAFVGHRPRTTTETHHEGEIIHAYIGNEATVIGLMEDHKHDILHGMYAEKES